MTTMANPICGRCGRETYEAVQPCYNCRDRERRLKDGLRWAKIEPLPSADFFRPWSPLAMLGEIAISHSGRGYWIAKGLVPLATAIELYADPVGRDVIRVEGHCGCPAPIAPWVTWRDGRSRDAIQLADRKNEAEFDRYISGPDGYLRDASIAGKTKYKFVDDPSAVGFGFIELYHIDGDLGLRVFADILRKRGDVPSETAVTL